ncbi:1-(5-phosphoribosyl)-5-[(5-phosphoribosylamino)methylideneamino]imidazole-4-carboxamide isomerase [Allobaculum stercoricanis]|uniref:1-(5-phosphoribosyl)-5-[(5- phosphoribosylamino)methylideneamino]imidazole-4- carboxamide isomerase n=1 Tax=Allobaculum stercoricanis TaxID=174709 RepID=UPI0029439E44|nr:1-(5-phosphoribosyl)-5-[(5-phosphoribosylamino)methylideneamino]imidazole-4-carboxamide isomerase [Allobaculum stercoricanis]
MILLPAIDILEGKPVRLRQGDYNQANQVAASVLETAQSFAASEATWVHLVDLDGAKAGRPINDALILQTAQALSIPVEVGGGIRNESQARMYLDGGVERVILSTAALADLNLVKRLAKAYPGRIAVGLDCKDSRVKVSGWLEDGGVMIEDAVQMMEEAGIQTLIVTDICRDGMLSGPSYELYRKLSKLTTCDLIASGGIASLEDLEQLEKEGNVVGAITGKAIYSGAIDLKPALMMLNKAKGK